MYWTKSIIYIDLLNKIYEHKHEKLYNWWQNGEHLYLKRQKMSNKWDSSVETELNNFNTEVGKCSNKIQQAKGKRTCKGK